jgi:hypothetical protein
MDLMFFSARNSMDAGPFWRNTPTLLTGMPEATEFSSGGVSAQPNMVWSCATALIVLPEPLPGSTFRSMPSSA